MLLIITIIPLLIYYSIILPLIKIKILNKKVTNIRFRRILFIVLFFLPIGDQILGYIVYKTLCFTSAGTTIYQTITDEKEQKVFWFNAFKDNYAKNDYVYRTNNGIIGEIFLTKDLQKHAIAYWNECESRKRASYDCEKANEFIKKNNIHIYEKISHDEDIIKLFNKYGRHHKLSTTYLIDDENNQLIPAYLNECNSSLENPKFEDSCKYTNDFIEEHNIPNIINLPKSKYIYKNKNSNLIFPLPIKNREKLIKNFNSNNVIAKKNNYDFMEGLYLSIFSPAYHGVILSCEKEKYIFKEQIIPNPYIENLKKLKGE